MAPDASSIDSDGGEATLIILAEQPGDDARAGTVSILEQRTALRGPVTRNVAEIWYTVVMGRSDDFTSGQPHSPQAVGIFHFHCR